jgi:hypothetical protein
MAARLLSSDTWTVYHGAFAPETSPEAIWQGQVADVRAHLEFFPDATEAAISEACVLPIWSAWRALCEIRAEAGVGGRRGNV